MAARARVWLHQHGDSVNLCTLTAEHSGRDDLAFQA